MDRLVTETIQKEYDKAMTILRDNRDSLDKLANFLYEKETITGEEFMDMLRCDGKV